MKQRCLGDRIFFVTMLIAAGILLFVLLGLCLSLIHQSMPSIKAFGWSFIWTHNWDPVVEQFGALSAIIGTLLSSLIALVVAVPISFGIAVLISQILPHWAAQTLARIIELMAGIPSIIYGMWGLFVLVPYVRSLQPHLIHQYANIPILNYIFGGMPIGLGIMTAGLVLAIMIIPLISSMMRDVLNNVPVLIQEAAYGVGATRFEVVYHVLTSYARAGLFGGVILGLGRALGETMAVTFVIGNSHALPKGLFMPGTTISASIANEFTEAMGTTYPAALLELSLILFAITLITLVISRYLLSQSTTRGGSQ